MQSYIETARRRQQQRKEHLHQLRQHGITQAKTAAQLLRKEFGASRIVLFGSMLNESTFHETSDMDLAVWDLPPSDYIAAVARLLQMSDFSIDLVEAESARSYLQESIAQGLEL